MATRKTYLVGNTPPLVTWTVVRGDTAAGTNGRGGGGGANGYGTTGDTQTGGDGGDGIVIIRYISSIT